MTDKIRSSTLVYCNHCGTPLFEITKDGYIVVKAKHHGERHTSEIRLRDLLHLTQPGGEDMKEPGS